MKNSLIFLSLSLIFLQTAFSNAPESIAGYSITFSEPEGDETSSYGTDGKSHDNWGSTDFSYEKLNANTGRITYEENTAPEIETLTFTSTTGGTFAWVEYADTNRDNIVDEGNGTFAISQDADYAPESIAGYSITFSEPEGDETSSYGTDGKSHDNWGSTDFSYEKLTANTGRITYEENTAPEIETLTFTSATGGTFAWVEYEDTTRENILDEGTGTFAISQDPNYAPSSLVGKTIYIPEEGFDANYSFTEDEAYYVDPGKTLDQVDGISYSYVANTSTTATLTLARETGDVIHQISFSSPTTADSNWTDLESNETDSAELKILTEDHWPSTLAGWSYQGTSMNDTFYFVDEGHAVFYDASDSNFSNRELSNITYTWEQIGPRIGKLTTSLGEETLLFFESNTSGFFDWEEIGSDAGNSGQFDLFYYPLGKAFESLVGSSISIGDTTYVFTSTNAVTVHSPSGTPSQEYAYLRENEDEGLLSLGSSLYKLKFYNHQYGRIVEGGSGYFSIHKNWATKGWVYYDELPWIYSNNQGEWLYQVLSNNNATNETELMYYDPWDKVVSQDLDLNYTDQRVFSTWEDYDDFSGPELNSSKWDTAWWDGGMAPSIEQDNNRVVFTNGSSYEANLSDQMNVSNPQAESEYSYGYDASYGFAPSTIADMNVRIHEEQILPEYSDYGVDYIYYSDGLLSRYDWDEQQEVQEPYSYERTGPNTAKITMQSSGELYVADLTFTSQNSATGTWEEQEDGVTYSGSLTFDIVFSPHSLLEFSESDEIDGIEFEIMIPDNAPDQTCIGLFALDYQSMFSAVSEEDEENALKFDLDLCYFDGSLSLEYNLKNQATGVEEGNNSDVSLDSFHKAAFFFEDNKILFYLNNTLAGVHNYVRGAEKFVIRAQNEQNLDFSAYLKNVRVLRKKSYPQGWMWTEYYPWAYSHETGGWLYFELAKDSAGKPVMNYYDHNTKAWDLYGPSLNQFTDR